MINDLITRLVLRVLFIILVVIAIIQFGKAEESYIDEPNNFVAIGMSYNHDAAPAIVGTGLYARQLGVVSPKTYAFTVVDALPTTISPVMVTTQFGGGIAQRLLQIGRVPIYIPTSIGVSYTGTNTGWAWTSGAMGIIRFKENNQWGIAPHVRVIKSSVSNGEGYQIIVGMGVSWGW